MVNTSTSGIYHSPLVATTLALAPSPTSNIEALAHVLDVDQLVGRAQSSNASYGASGEIMH